MVKTILVNSGGGDNPTVAGTGRGSHHGDNFNVGGMVKSLKSKNRVVLEGAKKYDMAN